MTATVVRPAARESSLHLTLAVGSGIYLVVAAWAMLDQPYDVWGGLVVAPIVVVGMRGLVRRLFADTPALIPIAMVGLAAKLIGSAVRYWVAFGAYGGASDAERYHQAGRIVAGDIHRGGTALWNVVPSGESTLFIERVTGTLYAIVGSSKLAGFVWFATFGFLGVLLTIRAAVIAAPRLDLERYAWFCMLCPSLIFWPSSIGKEAWMTLSFGVMTFGVARLLEGGRTLSSLLLAGLGTVMAGTVRPHTTWVFLAAGVAALVVQTFRHFASGRSRRLPVVIAALTSVVALFVVGRQALDFLVGEQGDESLVTQIDLAYRRTLDMTAQGGSEFRPPSVNGPLDYPFAVVRTLTRPLLNEVVGLTDLIPAIETTLILVIAVLGLRRFGTLRAMYRSSALTVFHIVVTVTLALGYASFSNLGILVRQRSLLLPSLLFLLCLPYSWQAPRAEQDDALQFDGPPVP